MKVLLFITYCHFLNFIRNKAALFIFCIFPVIIFSIFGSLWGINSGYIFFLLSGVIGMNILSDGLSSAGPLIKESYDSGLIKYFNKQLFNPVLYFIGFILCRIGILITIMLLLCLTNDLLFDNKVTGTNIINFIIGILIGMFIFSFMGLILTFSGIKIGANTTIVNFINYFILFSSNVFYPADSFNETIGFIGNMLPLNPILKILREGHFSPILLIWITIPVILFLFMIKKIKFSR